MAHALHADKPNKLLHFDFLFMGVSDIGPEYTLILKDDASSFVWLDAYDTATSTNTEDSLLNWFACFRVFPTWVSDQGPYLKNELISEVNRALHSQHHFTTPHAPQSNGTL